jgi:hypothetical protein
VIGFEIRFRPELRDGLAVHRDAAFDDQFLGLTPAGDAGLRQNLLETFLSHRNPVVVKTVWKPDR